MNTFFFFSDTLTSGSIAEDAADYTTYCLCGGTAQLRHKILHQLWRKLEAESAELFAMPERPAFCTALCYPQQRLLFTAMESERMYPCSCPELQTRWISLSSFIQHSVLQQHQEVLQYSWKEYQTYRQRSEAMQTAAGAVCEDLTALGRHCILTEKLKGFCQRLIQRLLPKQKKTGTLSIRQSIALTSDGIKIAPLPQDWTVLLMEDPWLYAAGICVEELTDAALQRGYQCVISMNPCLLEPIPFYLSIPQIRTIILTTNTLFPYSGDYQKRYRCHRFYDTDLQREKKLHDQFDRNMIQSLIRESAGALTVASKIDLIMQQYYQKATISDAAEQIVSQILREIS